MAHQVADSFRPWSALQNGKTSPRTWGQAAFSVTGAVRSADASICHVWRLHAALHSRGHMGAILRYKWKSPAVVPVTCQCPLRLITSPYAKGWLPCYLAEKWKPSLPKPTPSSMIISILLHSGTSARGGNWKKMIIELNLWLQSVASAPRERTESHLPASFTLAEGEQAENTSISR